MPKPSAVPKYVSGYSHIAPVPLFGGLDILLFGGLINLVEALGGSKFVTFVIWAKIVVLPLLFMENGSNISILLSVLISSTIFASGYLLLEVTLFRPYRSRMKMDKHIARLVTPKENVQFRVYDDASAEIAIFYRSELKRYSGEIKVSFIQAVGKFEAYIFLSKIILETTSTE